MADRSKHCSHDALPTSRKILLDCAFAPRISLLQIQSKGMGCMLIIVAVIALGLMGYGASQ